MTNPTAEERGWVFAFARSLALSQKSVDDEDHWYAPGPWRNTPFDEMPNCGKCRCGAEFYVSDVYHFYATCDETWHTRQKCIPIPVGVS